MKPTENCVGDIQMNYERVVFTLADCRDWSIVQLINPPKPRPPWPYLETNLLQNWHFDHDGMAPWQPAQAELNHRNMVNWSQLTSRAPADRRYSQTHIGVRYLQVSCAASDCDPPIYQDVAIGDLPPPSAYDYGFSGVIDGAQNATMTAALSEHDRNGKELWTTSFDATVRTEYRGTRAVDSVYKASSVFLKTSPPVTLKPGAVVLRFSL